MYCPHKLSILIFFVHKLFIFTINEAISHECQGHIKWKEPVVIGSIYVLIIYLNYFLDMFVTVLSFAKFFLVYDE